MRFKRVQKVYDKKTSQNNNTLLTFVFSVSITGPFTTVTYGPSTENIKEKKIVQSSSIQPCSKPCDKHGNNPGPSHKVGQTSPRRSSSTPVENSESVSTHDGPSPTKIPRIQNKDTQLDIINKVVVNVLKLGKKVESLSGVSKTGKEYLYLDELVTQCYLMLDEVQSNGRRDVILAKKNCIHLIEDTSSKLKAKVIVTQENMNTNQGTTSTGSNETL